MPQRLRILHLSPLPASPPRFGAQARIHGLLSALGARHDITALALVDDGFDLAECEQAMREYCREVVLLPNRHGTAGRRKRVLQLRSLVSTHSFEHLLFAAPDFQRAVDRLQQQTRFDIVILEFPYQAHLRLRGSPAGTPGPKVVIDSHEIAHDMVRQFARRGAKLGRRVYGEIDWRKLRREEWRAYRDADGVFVCSTDDEARVRAAIPTARTKVVPNAANVEFFQPRASDPTADNRTIVFFGLLSTQPNIDGVRWLVQEIWPIVARARPDARLKILGKDAPPAVTELAGAGVEVVGFVDDLRPHLAECAAIAVALRLGGGTRLKIVEGMSMSKAIVSTTLGAEGIVARDGEDILIADEPVDFARALLQLLDHPEQARRIGANARRLAVERYAWPAAAATLEQFCMDILSGPTTAPTLRVAQPKGAV